MRRLMIRRPHPLRTLRRLLGSVRVRITLWYLAILALVFVVFGAIVSATAIRQDNSVQRTNLTALWTELSSTYVASSGSLTIQDPWDTPTSAPQKPDVSKPKPVTTVFGPYDFAVLLDTNFALKQRFGPLSDQAVAQTAALALQHANPNSTVGDYPAVNLTVVTFGGTNTLAYTLYSAPIMSHGRVAATLVVGQPTQDTRTLSALVPGLLIAGPLTLLVAALGGYWLATRALRPVRLITRAAEEIEETDLSRRLNLKSRDELGALAATFDRMLARLEAAFVRQRQFTGDASHELRTPLSIVAAETEHALAAPRTADEYRRTLEVVQSENAYMARLVEQLLTLARADAGQLRLRAEPLDLSDVALEVVERLAPLARQRGVVLSTGALPELRVRGDRTALGLALGNLVENAIKHAGRGERLDGDGGHVRVETGAADRGDGRRVAWACVEDDGPGIAAGHLPHLFERFYRADAARARDDANGGERGGTAEGSGLGLAIAHEIAAAHGATIGVQSVKGCGSTFTFELPAD